MRAKYFENSKVGAVAVSCFHTTVTETARVLSHLQTEADISVWIRGGVACCTEHSVILGLARVDGFPRLELVMDGGGGTLGFLH